MTDYSQGACIDEDPREWDGLGTDDAVEICGNCPIRLACLADALDEQPREIMRAAVAFDKRGRQRNRGREAVDHDQAVARHAFWRRLHDHGISYAEIARRAGVHHTTVINAVRQLEEPAA